MGNGLNYYDICLGHSKLFAWANSLLSCRVKQFCKEKLVCYVSYILVIELSQTDKLLNKTKINFALYSLDIKFEIDKFTIYM